MRLHLGCGRTILDGWVNVDIRPFEGVDLVADFEEGLLPSLKDNTVESFLCVHTIEHIQNVKPFMQELHRIATPDAEAVFRTPYGTSDDADADPDHVRRFLWSSWGYYGQPFYWRTPDPYRGDWDVSKVVLLFHQQFEGLPQPVLEEALKTERNCVMEMIAVLRAVKPIRPQDRSLLKQIPLQFGIGRLQDE